MRLVSGNPLRLLFGPIFQMEMRTAGRRRSTYAFRALMGGVILFFFAITLLTAWREVSYEGSSFSRMQAGQNIAPTLVVFVLWTQYVALVLLAPMITGPALCDERRNRTMAALLTTPLTAWEIVLGKLTGRLAQAIILALVAVPMVFAARMLGGVSIDGIIAAVTLTAVSVFMCSALALLLSAFSPRATTAATGAFVVFLVFNFGPIALAAVYEFWIRPHFRGLPGVDWSLAFATSLPSALGAVVHEYFLGDPIGIGPMAMWGWAAVYGSVVTVGAVILAGLLLRRAMRRDPETLMSRPEPKRKKKRRKRGGAAPSETEHDPEAEVETPSRVVGDRPVLWRELNIGAFRKKRRLIEATLALVVTFVLLYLNDGMEEQAAHMFIVAIGVGILMLQAVFAATGAIAHERQASTLEVLLTTPLKPGQIILGKAAGAIRRMWFVPLAVTIHFAIAVMTGVYHPAVLPLLALAVLPSVVMLTSSGMLLGVLFRKATNAAIANLFLALMLYAGLLFALAFVQSSFALWDNQLFKSAFTGLFSINPFAMSMISALGTSDVYHFAGNRGPSLEFDMPNHSASLYTFVVYLTVAAAIELAAGALCLFAAARSLPERVGRSS